MQNDIFFSYVVTRERQHSFFTYVLPLLKCLHFPYNCSKLYFLSQLYILNKVTVLLKATDEVLLTIKQCRFSASGIHDLEEFDGNN